MIFGDGEQRRNYLYIDDLIRSAPRRLVRTGSQQDL